MFRKEVVFLHHEPCPKCHSRDNLGRWSDGHAHCFGCGYFEAGVRSLQLMGDRDNELGSKYESMRRASTSTLGQGRFCKELPDEARRWIKKYGVTDEEIQTHSIVWLPDRESLAFGYEPESGNYYTRRYFGRNPDYPRYIHSKHKDFVVLDADQRNGKVLSCEDCLIFVEDFVSAIRVSRIVSASPVFGSTVGLERINRASKRFKRQGIWLDTDMYPKAVREANRGRSCGFNVVGAINGIHPDPKDHSDKEIEYLIRELFNEKTV